MIAVAVLASLGACTAEAPTANERTTLTLRAENPDRASLEKAKAVLAKRAELNGLKATVTVNADNTITVSAEGKTDLGALTIVGALRFRKVIDVGNPAASPVSCAELGSRPVDAIRRPETVTLCSEGAMYLLGPSKVETADVSAAKAEKGPVGNVVTLSFSAAGQGKWATLTREAFANEGGQCAKQALGSQGGHCQIAIVVDQGILAVPEILSPDINGATISAKFSEAQAKSLANLLAGGELPVVLTPAA